MITAEMFEDIVSEAEEICKIIGKIQVTMKKKISIRNLLRTAGRN